MHAESEIRIPLIIGDKSYRQITDDIIAPIEGKAARGWYTLTTMAFLYVFFGEYVVWLTPLVLVLVLGEQ